MWKKVKVTNIRAAIGSIDTYFIVRQDKPFGEEHFHTPACLFLLIASAKGVNLNTTKARAADLVVFLNTLEFPECPEKNAQLDWQKLTDKERSGYLRFLQVNRGNSDSTVVRAVSTLRKFYEFSRDDFPVLDSFSTFKFYFSSSQKKSNPKIATNTPKRVKSNYIDRLIFDIIETNISGKSSFVRQRNLIGIRLGRNTGLRAHEVTLKGNFDTRKLRSALAEMRVRGESTLELDISSSKGNKSRPVVLKKKDLALIERFLKGTRGKFPEGDLLCRSDGLSFSQSSVPASGWFSDALTSAMPVLLSNYGNYCNNPKRKFILDKASLKYLGFHSGRHSYATDLVGEAYENGNDPKELLLVRLGHENKGTLSAYITVEALISGRIKDRDWLDVSLDEL